jgi:rod shape-determining protein MreC
MRHLNIIALLAFLGSLVWVFTWKTPSAIAAKTRVMNVFSPFIRTGAAAQRGLGAAVEPDRTPGELLAENTALKVEVQRQRILLEEFDRVQKENNDFRRMLDFARSHPLRLTTARILTRNSATYWSSATLDRGMSDELAPDLAVRTAEGLVGKLVHLWRHESEVLFITDESCKVAVKIEGSPDQGILSGVRGVSGRTPELRITYLARDAIVPIGAKVYTSGKGTVFPSGILVGEVTRFLALDDGGEALVRPAVDFDRLKYVFVIDRGESQTADVQPAGEASAPR